MKRAINQCSGLKLLTAGNPKTVKGEKKGYVTFILHLAPARLSGFNVCPMATAGCRAACLNTAGRGGIAAGGTLQASEIVSGARLNNVQRARIRRTRLFFEERETFGALLFRDIVKASSWARSRSYVPVFRLNGTSDIRWETVRFQSYGPGPHDRSGATVFEAFPQLQFYDYTKIANRKALPANYHLTFSLADGNTEQARQAITNGLNVAAVFRNKATVAEYERTGYTLGMGGLVFPVLNGDETDLRFLDNGGNGGAIIALYAKGNARRDTSGFVRD